MVLRGLYGLLNIDPETQLDAESFCQPSFKFGNRFRVCNLFFS